MLAEMPYAVFIAAAVLVGLWCSNIFYDYKVPQYLSRKIAHMAGGTGLLLCALLFDSWLWPLILAAGFTVLLLGARFIRSNLFRGLAAPGGRWPLPRSGSPRQLWSVSRWGGFGSVIGGWESCRPSSWPMVMR